MDNTNRPLTEKEAKAMFAATDEARAMQAADREKYAEDAPVWYSAEEAAAWAAGYNRAVFDHGTN